MQDRDIVLEGAEVIEVEQLQRVASGLGATATARQLARIAAKGWLDTVGDTHLITLTGRALLERQVPGPR